MAVTAQGSGTQTATVTTEHTLLDIAVAGVFNLEVDTVNMAAGDILELRVYQIILTAGTYSADTSSNPGSAIYPSPASAQS